MFAPVVTPFGNDLVRRRAAARDVVAEVGVLEDELVQLRSAEHPVVVDVDRVELVRAVAPVVGRALRRRAVGLRVRGCGRSAPSGTAAAFRFAVDLAGDRGSRGRASAKTPSLSGNSPSVLTACVVSCWVRSTATKKYALSLRDRAAEAAAELVAAVVAACRAVAPSFSVCVCAFIDLSRNSSKTLP